MSEESIYRFVEGLRPYDASVAVAVLELLRQAGPDGTADRGDWLAAIRRAAPVAAGHTGGDGALGAAGADASRYLEEHVLARLAEAGIATGEPAGDAWERVRLRPA